MYKLDRNSFKMQTFKEAENTVAYWKGKTVEERFSAAWFIICSAFNLPYSSKIKLDRTQFKMRKNG